MIIINFLEDVKDFFADMWDRIIFMKTKTKRRLLWFGLPTLLVVLGGIIFYISPYRVAWQANNAQDKFMSNLSIGDKAPTGNYDYGSAATTPSFADLMKLRNQKAPITGRGTLSIPSVNVKTPVLEGTAATTLAWGPGTARPGEVLGKDNFAIQGHNYIKTPYLGNWFLSNLQSKVAQDGQMTLDNIKVKLNAPIYVRNKSTVYEYDVAQRNIVDVRNPNSYKFLTKDAWKIFKKPIITIATCYEQQDILHPNQRIVIIGKLVKATPVGKFKQFDKVFENK